MRIGQVPHDLTVDRRQAAQTVSCLQPVTVSQHHRVAKEEEDADTRGKAVVSKCSHERWYRKEGGEARTAAVTDYVDEMAVHTVGQTQFEQTRPGIPRHKENLKCH